MSLSGIYSGQVAHPRPGKHRLRYKVTMLALDLDEMPALDKRLKFFSHNRLNLLSLMDRDHGQGANAPLRPQVEEKLRAAKIRWDGGRIVMLTAPRMLNYVFNPLSVYFCYGRDGEVAAIVYEVSNTFGERHFYTLPAAVQPDGQVSGECEKHFFVSPFLEMKLRYQFHVRPPGDVCMIAMTVRRGDEIALTASFSGVRQSFTDPNILRMVAGDPLMSVKITAGIHWEALKMWLKGVRYLGRPLAREGPVGATHDTDQRRE